MKNQILSVICRIFYKKTHWLMKKYWRLLQNAVSSKLIYAKVNFNNIYNCIFCLKIAEFLCFYVEIENVSIAQWSIIRCSIQLASDIMKCTLDEFDNPAISSLQCGPDYFRSLLPLSEDCLTCFEMSLKSFEVCFIVRFIIYTVYLN